MLAPFPPSAGRGFAFWTWVYDDLLAEMEVDVSFASNLNRSSIVVYERGILRPDFSRLRNATSRLSATRVDTGAQLSLCERNDSRRELIGKSIESCARESGVDFGLAIDALLKVGELLNDELFARHI